MREICIDADALIPQRLRSLPSCQRFAELVDSAD
jgi:hypothetical protein